MSPVAPYVDYPIQPRVLIEDFADAKEYGLLRVPCATTREADNGSHPPPSPSPCCSHSLPSLRLAVQCPSSPFCAG